MRLLIVSLTYLLSMSAAYATTVSQSDWSGGSGVVTPVSSWSNTFMSASQIDYSASSLRLVTLDPVEHLISDYMSEPTEVGAADMDGDGDTDVVIAGLHYVYLFVNVSEQGTEWIRHQIIDAGILLHIVDFNDDGNMDIISTTERFNCYSNVCGTGLTWECILSSSPQYAMRDCWAEDIDGDGDLDIMSATTSNFSWWEEPNTGDVMGIRHYIDTMDGSQSIQGIDMDKDGDIDAVGAFLGSDDIIWCENRNIQGECWPMHFVATDLGDPSCAYAADIDGDGDIDVAGTERDADVIEWWENIDGYGEVWVRHVLSDSFDLAWDVVVEDADNDGDNDILGAAFYGDEIAYWENTGNMNEWVKHTVTSDFPRPESVRFADIDGDGINDVLSVSKTGEYASWWSILEYPATGSLESSILDTQGAAFWLNFSADYDEPEGTCVSFQFRSSNNWQEMGDWSPFIHSPDTTLAGILMDSTRYLQYRATLHSSTHFNTPVLNEISFSYEPYTGIGGPDSTEPIYFGAVSSCNPSCNCISFDVSLSHSESVSVVIYDLSGRVIREDSVFLQSGCHRMAYYDIHTGFYICSIEAGDGREVLFFMVVSS